jgi:hypothetical protein
VEPLLATGLNYPPTEIVSIKKYHNLDADWGLERVNELRRQLRDLAKRQVQGRALLLLDVEADAIGNDLIPETDNGADILMPVDISLGDRVLHLGHRVYVGTPFGRFRVTDDQIERLASLRCSAITISCAFWRSAASGSHRATKKKLLKYVVRLGIQISVEGGHVAPTPGKGNDHDQQAKVRKMLPVKVRLQGVEKLIQDARHAYDAEHEAILHKLMANGKLHPLLNHQQPPTENCLSCCCCQTLAIISPEKVSQLESLADRSLDS